MPVTPLKKGKAPKYPDEDEQPESDGEVASLGDDLRAMQIKVEESKEEGTQEEDVQEDILSTLTDSVLDNVVRNLPLTALYSLACASTRFRSSICGRGDVKEASVSYLRSPIAENTLNLISQYTQEGALSLLEGVKLYPKAVQAQWQEIQYIAKNWGRIKNDEELDGQASVSPLAAVQGIQGMARNVEEFQAYDNFLDWLNDSRIRQKIKLNSRSLGLENLVLTRIPTSILIDDAFQAFWKQLRVLNLHGNRIRWLPNEFRLLQSLKELYIVKNRLSVFPTVIFELKVLEELDLSYNQILGIPAGIKELTALLYLGLTQNRISIIPDVIGELVNLQNLCLGKNSIKAIPKEVGALQELQILELGANKIDAIPEEISRLQKLHMLVLTNNKIANLPTELTQLMALKYFYLTSNPMTYENFYIFCVSSNKDWLSNVRMYFHNLREPIEGAQYCDYLAQWQEIQYLKNKAALEDRGTVALLHASEDTIENIKDIDRPARNTKEFEKYETWLDAVNVTAIMLKIYKPGYGDLSATALNLSYSNFTRIPKSVLLAKRLEGFWSRLQTLDISHNFFTQLPDEMVRLAALKTLSLACNQFRVFPEIICRLNTLTELNLDENKISKIPGSISNLARLKKLSFSINRLSEIPEELWQITTLNSLSLGGNKISEISKRISNLQNLTSVCFSRNRLVKFPKELCQLLRLSEIYLYKNNITEIPPEIENLVKLHAIHIDQNRLTALPKELMQIPNFERFGLNFIHHAEDYTEEQCIELLKRQKLIEPGKLEERMEIEPVQYSDEGSSGVSDSNNGGEGSSNGARKMQRPRCR